MRFSEIKFSAINVLIRCEIDPLKHTLLTISISHYSSLIVKRKCLVRSGYCVKRTLLNNKKRFLTRLPLGVAGDIAVILIEYSFDHERTETEMLCWSLTFPHYSEMFTASVIFHVMSYIVHNI